MMGKEEINSRRKFLRSGILTTVGAGTILVNTKAFSAFIPLSDVRKLSSEQQEFMLRYGKWMDEFISIIRKKQAEPGDQEHQKMIMVLSEMAESFKPELTRYLKDETFSIVYHASIDRMSKEIV